CKYNLQMAAKLFLAHQEEYTGKKVKKLKSDYDGFTFRENRCSKTSMSTIYVTPDYSRYRERCEKWVKGKMRLPRRFAPRNDRREGRVSKERYE
ncbi:MAG: hypothetical protein AB1742_04790, partial [bacterium]